MLKNLPPPQSFIAFKSRALTVAVMCTFSGSLYAADIHLDSSFSSDTVLNQVNLNDSFYVDAGSTVEGNGNSLSINTDGESGSGSYLAFYNLGTVQNLESMTVGDGVFMNGSVRVNGNVENITPEAMLSIQGDLTFATTQHNRNDGMIEADSLTITGKQTYAFANYGTLTIQSGEIDGYISNYGDIKVGTDTVVFNGLYMGEGSTLTDLNGNAVHLVINVIDGENTHRPTIDTDLTVKSLTANNEISLFVLENLAVEENMDLLNSEGAPDSNLYVQEGAVLDVGGDLTVYQVFFQDGTINTTNLNVAMGNVQSTATLNVEGWMTVTANFTSHSADSFNVKKLRTDNSNKSDVTKSSRVFVPLYNGTYEFEELVLGGGNGSYNEGDGRQDYSGIQLFNSDVIVDRVTIESGTNGLIDFRETTDSDTLTMTVNELINDGGTLFLHSEGTGVDNALNIERAVFNDGSKIENRNDTSQAGKLNLTIDELIAENLTVEEFTTEASVFNLGTAFLSGEKNVFKQKVTGLSQGSSETSMYIELQEGARAQFDEVSTQNLNVRLNDLQGDQQFSVTDLQDCQTCQRIQVTVDGKANNANPQAVVEQLKQSVSINSIDSTGTSIQRTYQATIEEGNIWGAIYLDCDGNIVVDKNKKTASIAQSTAVSFMQWRNETDDIYKRLGDLRYNAEDDGLWVRTYGAKMEYGDQNVETDTVSLQVGYDRALQTDYGPTYIGGALSYTDGDSDFDTGNGEFNTVALTAYASWILDNNWYIDANVKYGWLNNEYDIRYQNFAYDGDFDTQAMSLSVELGKRFPINDKFFVEPQVQTTYSHIFDEDYRTSNGLTVKQSDVDSWVARIGVMGGYLLPQDKGMAYVRASYLYDFDGETRTEFIDSASATSSVVDQDLGGSWYEVDLGISGQLSKSVSAYAEFSYAAGGEIESPYRWNLGVRYQF